MTIRIEKSKLKINDRVSLDLVERFGEPYIAEDRELNMPDELEDPKMRYIAQTLLRDILPVVYEWYEWYLKQDKETMRDCEFGDLKGSKFNNMFVEISKVYDPERDMEFNFQYMDEDEFDDSWEISELEVVKGVTTMHGRNSPLIMFSKRWSMCGHRKKHLQFKAPGLNTADVLAEVWKNEKPCTIGEWKQAVRDRNYLTGGVPKHGLDWKY